MPAPVFFDRVQEATSTTGTGNITLTGAATDQRTFNGVVPNGSTVEFVIDDNLSNWEVVRGVFAAPSTLSRVTVLASSNGNNLVNFGNGTKDVFLTVSALSLGALNSITLNKQTANYTLTAADYDGRTRVDFNSSSNLVLTVPSQANVSCANGMTVVVSRSGNGTVTITQQANVTVANSSSNTLRAQNSFAAIQMDAPDIWKLFGDTT